MSSPGISVIICTYNRKDVLERALAAYRNQTFRDFEVIVTSDGSSDGTDEMMEALRGQSGYPLHYIRQADNGFRKSLAVNKAIRLATGRILVFADDDMIPPPRYLESYARVFDSASNADALLVYSKYIPVDTDDERFTTDNIRNGNYMKRVSLSDRIHLFYWKLKYRLYIRQNHPRRPKLNGNNFAVSAAAIRAINGLDSDFTGWGRRLAQTPAGNRDKAGGSRMFRMELQSRLLQSKQDNGSASRTARTRGLQQRTGV